VGLKGVGLCALKLLLVHFFAQKYGTCEKLTYHSTFTNHELGMGNILILSYIMILRANSKHIVVDFTIVIIFFLHLLVVFHDFMHMVADSEI